MKQTQHLKLRIERNGKVQHRNLRNKDTLTVGRSPDNDVVVYGESYPKKARMFVPTSEGYELRIFRDCRGEVLKDKSRLAINDLLHHEILPKRNGHYVLPLTQGKAGYVHFGDVRIDFMFDTSKVQTIEFAGFSASRSFLKTLADDVLFRAIMTGCFVLGAILLNYVRSIPYEPPKNDVSASEAVQRIARWVPKVEEPEEPEARIGQTTEEVAAMDSKKDEEKKPELNSTKESEGRKEGFGPKRDDPGQGVNPEELGALGLLVGEGLSDSPNDFIDNMLQDDLVQDLGEVMTNKPLKAGGRSKTGDLNLEALNAATRIGLGEGGGGAEIEDILSGVVGSTKSVNLKPKSRVEITRLGKVSGSEEALGARTEESLRKVLMANMGRLQYLFEKYLKTNPDIGGKIDVEVKIAANGRVSSVKVLRSDIPVPALERDIVSAIRRWKYEPIPSGVVTVVYPIVFMRT